MDFDALLAEAGVATLERSGLRLLSVEAVERLFGVLRERNAIVLGLEGFHVTQAEVQPRMDQIADFSSVMELPSEERSATSVHSPAEFLKKTADRTLMFDLCVSTER